MTVRRLIKEKAPVAERSSLRVVYMKNEDVFVIRDCSRCVSFSPFHACIIDCGYVHYVIGN